MEKTICGLNDEEIGKESMRDSFHSMCMSLSDETAQIIRINKQRWEIEEYFRIMRSKFKARHVYLSRDERIQAHFMACFLSSILYRMFEKRLKVQFTCEEIIARLRKMNFPRIKVSRYVPCYTRTDFTNALYEAFGLLTSYAQKQMKAIIKR